MILFRFYNLFLIIFIFGACSVKRPITLQDKLHSNIDNLQLHYRVVGSGEPLLMIHGFGSDSSTFDEIVPTLSKRFKIYLVDLKGFGNSPKPKDDNYSIYDQYLLVKKLILKNHIQNFSVIGHSIGGSVALLLAIDKDIKIKKMVLLDTPAYKQNLPKLLRYANIPIFGKLGFYILPSSYEVMEGYRYAFYDDSKIPKKRVKKLSKNLKSNNAKYAFLTANRELIPDDIDELVKKYKEIKIPTLIIWGYEDVVVRRSKAYKLHRDLKNSELRFIYHCGHIPQEEKPKETLKFIENFL